MKLYPTSYLSKNVARVPHKVVLEALRASDIKPKATTPCKDGKTRYLWGSDAVTFAGRMRVEQDAKNAVARSRLQAMVALTRAGTAPAAPASGTPADRIDEVLLALSMLSGRVSALQEQLDGLHKLTEGLMDPAGLGTGFMTNVDFISNAAAMERKYGKPTLFTHALGFPDDTTIYPPENDSAVRLSVGDLTITDD